MRATADDVRLLVGPRNLGQLTSEEVVEFVLDRRCFALASHAIRLEHSFQRPAGRSGVPEAITTVPTQSSSFWPNVQS